MQQQIEVKPQPSAENKCPDCLYMKLSLYKDDFVDSTLSDIEQLAVYLTINFNEQWESIFGGRIKFGLKGGELRLRLENGIIPYEKRELAGKLELSIQKERQEQISSESQSSIEVSYGDYKPGAKSNFNVKNTQGTTDKFQLTLCQVTTKGSEESPAWVFEVVTGEPILKGLLSQTKLATLHISGKPCRIQATFEISSRDIYLSSSEGLWSSDISRNRQALIERIVVLRLLESRLQPYLSRAELHYA